MKTRLFSVVMRVVLGVMSCAICLAVYGMEVKALTLEYDETKQEIVVAGVPETDDKYNYSVNGYIKFGDERIESFCYGTASIGYDVPEAQAYIFSYADKEFLFPCSGTYVMTAWIEKRDIGNWDNLEKSGKVFMEFYFQKKDESTNWGPGLPETMIEDWEIKDLQGKNKDMVVSGGSESYPYTWTINGKDIYNVPADDEKVNLEILSMDARFDAYIPGNEITNIKLDIAHSGDFGFTARLDYTLGAEHAGRYANLFYVLGPEKYEFVQNCQIDANGVATFLLNHASSYFVVIRDEAYTGETIVESTPVPTSESTSEPTSEQIPEVTIEPSTQSDGVTKENEDLVIENTESLSNVDESNKAEVSTNLYDNKSVENWGIIGSVAVVLVIIGALVVYFVKKNKEV